MVPYLFPNFLNDPNEYVQVEAVWNAHWQELIRWTNAGRGWRTPWLPTTFVDGTPCQDGNPIFSAVNPSRRLGLRVIQLEPTGNPRELAFWTDTFAKDEPEAMTELVIACVLTAETLLDVIDLMRQWISGGTVWLSQEGRIPSRGRHGFLTGRSGDGLAFPGREEPSLPNRSAARKCPEMMRVA